MSNTETSKASRDRERKKLAERSPYVARLVRAIDRPHEAQRIRVCFQVEEADAVIRAINAARPKETP